MARNTMVRWVVRNGRWTFREDEGAGEHCHEGAMFLFHQRAFDWLDTLLAA